MPRSAHRSVSALARPRSPGPPPISPALSVSMALALAPTPGGHDSETTRRATGQTTEPGDLMAHASFRLDAVTWLPASRELPGHLGRHLQDQLATAHDTTADQHSYEVVAGATQAAVPSTSACPP
jgi:hypothetical protein